MPDALVAGAGPTGLLAAFELERAGLDVLVLERDARPSGQSKALALQPRSSVASELSGIGITYPGTTGRATDVPVAPDGRGVLVGAALPTGWADRVESRDGAGPRLVRPDGYVAWAGGPGLDAALRRWFGPPAVPLTRSPMSATRHPSHG